MARTDPLCAGTGRWQGDERRYQRMRLSPDRYRATASLALPKIFPPALNKTASVALLMQGAQRGSSSEEWLIECAARSHLAW